MAIPVFDGHNDVLTKIYARGPEAVRAFLDGGADGHLDVPRAHAGGFAGGMFAIMTTHDPAGHRMPPSDETSARPDRYGPFDAAFAQRFAIAVTAFLFRLERENPGALKVVRNATELERCLAGPDSPLAVVLHFEGAEPIDPQLNALEVFYEAGLRSLGLVWSRPNAFAEGVPFAHDTSPDTGPGLTKAGRHLVEACNELGIAVDLSHLNERGFWHVAELSKAPLIASHSNAHTVCPATRNLTDEQLNAVAASRGIVGVNFSVGFTRPDGKNDADTPLTDVVRHFTYLCERMGVDHVGFGSDYDGTRVPAQLNGVEHLQRLVEALRDAGFSDTDLSKLATGNWVRVLKQTWATN